MSIGGFVSDIFGSHNKGNQGKYAMQAPQVDPNAYRYGGTPGGADEAANRYRGQAEAAQGRQGVQVDYSQANASREGQAGLAAAMRARAMGQTPSVAQMQADRQMQQAQAAQMAGAASARGAAGLALASQGAANNIANMQGAISNQAQQNVINERMAAEQAAFGAYGNMRSQDAQQSQFQAGLTDAQRGRNDAFQMGMTQNEMAVRNAQLAASQNQQAQQSSNALGAAQINAGVGGQNAAMNQQNSMNVMGMLQNAAGGAATLRQPVPGKADGGPVAGGRPYVVGERGPEIIVPAQSGTVVPNHQLSPADFVTSTWGTGGPAMKEQAAAVDAKQNWDKARNYALDRDATARAPLSGGLAVAGFTPGIRMSKTEPLDRRDAETAKTAEARRAYGVEMTGREEYEAEGAERRQAQASGTERKAATDARKATLGSVLGGMGKDMQDRAGKVDVGYHGPSGGSLGGVQLIPIPGRAMGGPVNAGDPYVVGEQGPEVLRPLSGPGSAAAPASFAGQSGMLGGSAMGELKTHSNFATRFQRDPTGGMVARAEGGPVEGGQPALVGERGPEVLALYEPPGKRLHQSLDGHAYLADAARGAVDGGVYGGAEGAAAPPVLARAPVKLAPKPTAQRPLTDEEMIRAIERLKSQMQSDHDARMAAGPAVRAR